MQIFYNSFNNLYNNGSNLLVSNFTDVLKTDLPKSYESYLSAEVIINPDILNIIGNYHMLNNENDRALTYYRKAVDYIDKFHHYIHYYTSFLYSEMAIAYLALGNTIDTEKYFQKALFQDHNNEMAKQYLTQLQNTHTKPTYTYTKHFALIFDFENILQIYGSNSAMFKKYYAGIYTEESSSEKSARFGRKMSGELAEHILDGRLDCHAALAMTIPKFDDPILEVLKVYDGIYTNDKYMSLIIKCKMDDSPDLHSIEKAILSPHNLDAQMQKMIIDYSYLTYKKFNKCDIDILNQITITSAQKEYLKYTHTHDLNDLHLACKIYDEYHSFYHAEAAKIYYNLAQCYVSLRQNEMAIFILRRALDLHTCYTDAMQMLYELLMQSKQYHSALVIAERISALSNNTAPYKNTIACLML
jgi:tetratricopeptide (TPR) repeat protein